MNLGARMTWKDRALGIATINAISERKLVIQHVALSLDGAALTGAWDLDDASFSTIPNLITHWIPVGDKRGLERAAMAVHGPLVGASLVDLVAIGRESEDSLRGEWEIHQAADPKKREKLVPIKQIAWPEIRDNETPSKALESVGRTPHPTTTPKEMRVPLALARLVQYIANCWTELEAERVIRKYLSDSQRKREILPPDWLRDNPPWWPKT